MKTKIANVETGVSEVFEWTTQDGLKLIVSDMGTRHIYHSLRMIFNHTVPAQFQMEGGRYCDVSKWPIEYRRQAVCAFVQELAIRTDLDDAMLKGLHHMKRAADYFKTKNKLCR